jgi:uncharacterized membrane protein
MPTTMTTLGKIKIAEHFSVKKIVSVSLLSFFLAILLNAFYCHNASPSLFSCSICKVKTSLSGTFSKGKIASSTAMAVTVWSMALFLLLSGVLSSRKIIVIDAHITFPFSNKAPPAR